MQSVSCVCAGACYKTAALAARNALRCVCNSLPVHRTICTLKRWENANLAVNYILWIKLFWSTRSCVYIGEIQDVVVALVGRYKILCSKTHRREGVRGRYKILWNWYWCRYKIYQNARDDTRTGRPIYFYVEPPNGWETRLSWARRVNLGHLPACYCIRIITIFVRVEYLVPPRSTYHNILPYTRSWAEEWRGDTRDCIVQDIVYLYRRYYNISGRYKM